MKPILEELFDGSICPDEVIVSKNPEFRPLNKKISEKKEIWKKKLSEDDFKQFEDLLDLCSQSNSMECTAAFMYGFKLGAVIMIEVLTGKEELV